ncbi:LacI family DNA-binding transcriptional regulator [Pseudomonadales bacterium]|jgi:LacI family transcriptional regulator|nr:LacI family DNA-binding transcriptional regulator [Pseudomonadales bacterium]MDC0374775.1 LacI family DNA-binding transcriptional regulator [Pseudomonadales bacterium]MDC1367024.1 LacI family DNA-binding transcriptional regulator [Pseudomonadales bacterium]
MTDQDQPLARQRAKAPTIFDVAKQAGVSIKTVSRVVNAEINVRESTREKVLAAINDLHYRPNTAARVLSGKRFYVIGLIYENPNEFSYVQKVLNGALKACEAGGYTLLLLPLTLPNPDLIQDVRRFVSQSRLDGVVLPAPIGDFTSIQRLLTDLDIPFARIAPRMPLADELSIHCNDEQASFDVTQFLIDQGHQQLGFIKGDPIHAATAHRFEGYLRALKANAIEYHREYVQDGQFSFESGRSATRALLDLRSPPSAIVASNDDMAAGTIFEARERGLRIPEDLSVVGFDDTPIASRIWPPLTTVRQPIVEMAEALTGLLIQKLRGEPVESSERAFACHVVTRASTGPRLVN